MALNTDNPHSTQKHLSKEVSQKRAFEKRFAICTLVTDFAEYQEMIDSFIKKGFDTDTCEYMHIDNSQKNVMDGFQAVNHFLRESNADYTLIVHQDVLLHDDDRKKLEDCISEMDTIDPNWGVLGNAGGLNIGVVRIYVTQLNKRLAPKDLPFPAETLDENFLLIKTSANIVVSSDLSGFHLYGTDLCILARTLGYNCWIIAFNLLHKSLGNCDEHFYKLQEQLIEKYAWAFRSRYIRTTTSRFYISESKLKRTFFSIRLINSISKRIKNAMFLTCQKNTFVKKYLERKK